MKNKTDIHNPVEKYQVTTNEDSYLNDIFSSEKKIKRQKENKQLIIISISIPTSTIEKADYCSKSIRMSRSNFTSACLEYCCNQFKKDSSFFMSFFNHE